MRLIYQPWLLLSVTLALLLASNCTSPTDSGEKEITDGEFIATVGNDYTFTGEAAFDTLITNYQYVPDAYQDTIVILSLKSGEIRVPDREPITTGIFLNALWDEENPEFEFGSNPYFVNYYIPPKIISMSSMYTIGSGNIIVQEYSEMLLSGTFDLKAEDALKDSITITGSFKALRIEE